ncbi:MAG: ABC transporter permease [Candidatus Hydrogenedentota bacterium]
MSILDITRFASGALRGHRLRAFLSILGVAIGVASVIALTSLGEGARLYIMGEFSTLGSNLIIVLPGKTETTGTAPVFGGTQNDLTLEDGRAVQERVRGVRWVAPVTIGSAAARYGERSREAMMVGTTAEFRKIRQLTLSSGRFLPEGELDREARICVLGAKVRTELFGSVNPLGEYIRIGGTRFRVIGTITPAGTTVSGNIDDMVMVPVATGMRLLNQRGLFRMLVEANSYEQVTSVKKDVQAILKERHDNVEDVTIFTQDAVLTTFNNILSILTYALGGIAAISLTVAGISIMNVMLVSVSERTKEVGLLKALGATYYQIIAVFLAEASILSSIGGFIGLAAGLAAGRILQYIYPEFPAQPPVWAVIAAVLVSVSVGVIFGAIPARRAARLDPVTALARR